MLGSGLSGSRWETKSQVHGAPIDFMHTQSKKAGAPGVDPGQLISESQLFPLHQTDVATDALWTACYSGKSAD